MPQRIDKQKTIWL